LVARKKIMAVLRLAGEPLPELYLDLAQLGALVVDEVRHPHGRWPVHYRGR